MMTREGSFLRLERPMQSPSIESQTLLQYRLLRCTPCTTYTLLLKAERSIALELLWGAASPSTLLERP